MSREDDRNTLGIPQPYHLPGYTGTCPDVRNRHGKSFGVANHLTLCDPKVLHADKLVLSRVKYTPGMEEDHETRRHLELAEIRKQLNQEVNLLKGTRRPRSLADRLLIDSPRLPLSAVTVECQGYQHSK